MNPLKKPGCIIALVAAFGLASLASLGLGIAGLFGDERWMGFSCERAKGTCTLHDRTDRTLAINDIRSVELISGDVSIGSRGASEREWWIVAHTKSAGDVEIADQSGSEKSAEEYRRAADQIRAFLAARTASVDARYAVRSGTANTVQNIFTGLLGLAFFVGLPLMWLRVKKRDERDFADAMALRKRQDEGGSPPAS